MELEDPTVVGVYLRPNVYNLRKDLSEHLHGKNGDEVAVYAVDAIHRMLELDLTGHTKSGEVSKEIAEYLCKKHDFDPTTWREEQ